MTNSSLVGASIVNNNQAGPINTNLNAGSSNMTNFTNIMSINTSSSIQNNGSNNNGNYYCILFLI
jgi:hypothetical protein